MIFNSAPTVRAGDEFGVTLTRLRNERTSVILDLFRDVYDPGDPYAGAAELNYVSTRLLEYVPGEEHGGFPYPQDISSLLAYIVGDNQDDPTDLLAGLDAAKVQGMAEHALRVSDRLIRLCEDAGRSY